MEYIIILILNILSFALPAYLIGSIPNAVWVGKVFYGKDVRNEGSKNAGATNVIRVLGLKPGLCVLVLDLLKGIIPLAVFSFFIKGDWYGYYLLEIGVAVGTVLGHVFPVFAGFRGGKGVATLVGILIMLFPQAFLIVASIFFGVLFLFRYVSLASITAAISLPILQFAFFGFDKFPLLIFAILIAFFVPLTHIKNIKRLIRKEEPKFVFSKHT
jgi:glycerol-3-phosphate acyltransferase PlsY